MNAIYDQLNRLRLLAKQDDALRRKLLETRNADDPMDSFCTLAQEAGCQITIGELFAAGQEYSDNQCKSTNGGNPNPYDYLDDTYENFLTSIE